VRQEQEEKGTDTKAGEGEMTYMTRDTVVEFQKAKKKRIPIKEKVSKNAKVEAYFAIASGSLGRVDGMLGGLLKGDPGIIEVSVSIRRLLG
jgi:hypothetical protein